MAVTRYRSSDASAPVLDGTAGSLVAVLDGCLVNGYGAQAAAGWTKAYSGTNKAAYRQGTGNQFSLRVQDDAPGAGGAREARMRGYETMSDVDTGTGLFPTSVQLSAGVICRKSTAANSTARAWIVVADSETIWFFVRTGDVSDEWWAWHFGGFFSFVSADGYRTMICGRATENDATTATEALRRPRGLYSQTLSGCYLARSYTGSGTSLAAGFHGDTYLGNVDPTFSTGLWNGKPEFPWQPDGGIWGGPFWVYEPSASVPVERGRLRGAVQLFHPIGAMASAADDVLNDQDELVSDAGDTLLILRDSGQYITSAGTFYTINLTTWETN